MIRSILIAAPLFLIFCACTKKKEEPAPAPEKPANSIKTMPNDTVHKSLKTKPDEDGAIFEKPKMSPIMIMKMQEIANKEKQQLTAKLDTGKAQKLYVAHCSRCHGMEGRGDGPESGELPIAPTNLKEWKLKFGSSLKEIVYTLNYGQSENEMPAFRATMKEDEIWQVARLVRGWVEANNP